MSKNNPLYPRGRFNIKQYATERDNFQDILNMVEKAVELKLSEAVSTRNPKDTGLWKKFYYYLFDNITGLLRGFQPQKDEVKYTWWAKTYCIV